MFSPLDLVRDDLSGNTAGADGGGIYLGGSRTSLTTTDDLRNRRSQAAASTPAPHGQPGRQQSGDAEPAG